LCKHRALLCRSTAAVDFSNRERAYLGVGKRTAVRLAGEEGDPPGAGGVTRTVLNTVNAVDSGW